MNVVASKRTARTNGNGNRLREEDRPAHDWYRFVLSFPPHLVRDYLSKFGATTNSRVLDPFCGTGTTLVESKKLGVASVGIEANPIAAFATRVKTSWGVDPVGLWAAASAVAAETSAILEDDGLSDSSIPLFASKSASRKALLTIAPELSKLLLKDSISPKPLHRVLRLLEVLHRQSHQLFDDHMKLALAKTIVFSASNLHFGPEVGLGDIRDDAPVVECWLEEMRRVVQDLHELQGRSQVPSLVVFGDSRAASFTIPAESIDFVITSPPYPNEKDYTRTTRLESVLLGMVKSKSDLRGLKQSLVRSNTRGVYTRDDDDLYVNDFEDINRISDAIEARRIELGKTSGFERLYHRVTKLYFGGMAKHLADIRRILKPGAKLAYVVGDQASYLRVMIRTGQLLGQIAESLGYSVSSIDLFRTRIATATGEELREEVVVLEWNPKSVGKGERAMSDKAKPKKMNMYKPIIEKIFLDGYKAGSTEVSFERSDLQRVAALIKVELPKNLGDLVYSFRYRAELPESIQNNAPAGKAWIIRPAGTAKYKFALVEKWNVEPNPKLAVTKVPDSTPGIVAKYSFGDEQALLTKVRYNRLIDVFLGLTCYSLQNHLRTQVEGMGQVETDEIYVGVDKRGAHFVIPVQGKGGKDKIGVVQIEQDFALCAACFPSLYCRPVAAQFISEDEIALFEFTQSGDGVAIASEKHYRLVPHKDVTEGDLENYRLLSEG